MVDSAFIAVFDLLIVVDHCSYSQTKISTERVDNDGATSVSNLQRV